MKKLFTLLVAIQFFSPVHAQKKVWDEGRWNKIIAKDISPAVRMSAQLYQLATLAANDATEAKDRLATSNLRYRKSDGKINIEIIYRYDENIKTIKDKINIFYLQNLGFDVDQSWKNRASIWVNVEDLLRLSATLNKDYFIRLVAIPKGDNEGPAAVNSASYKTAGGPGGAGKKVAIFDYGFSSMQTVINNGFAKTPVYVGIGGTPSTVAGVNFGGQEHGTACVETIYDHVPNADFELYAVGNATEKAAAVNTCIAHGVNVIAMSMSEYNTGWFDDTGEACDYANTAANAGILFVASCGNRALTHYEALFKDANANNRHEFSGTDEKNKVSSNIANGDGTSCYLSWNSSTGSDFDIYICRVSNDAILATSAATGTGTSAFEYVSWSNNTGVSVAVYFRVQKKSGPATTFEMFTGGGSNYQYSTAAGSNTSPSNSANLNIISLGATDFSYFTEPNGTTNAIQDYSSQGPTNSGNIAPKLFGPTNTATFIYSGSFGGTSGATSNTAGALVSFWSANPNLDATGVRQIVFRTSQLYKDFGVAGPDNIYGYGGTYLYTWENLLRYMYRIPENAAVINDTRPYYKLSVAETNAPTGAKVILLNGGNYTETGTFGTTGIGSGKSILYLSPFNFDGNFGF